MNDEKLLIMLFDLLKFCYINFVSSQNIPSGGNVRTQC